VFGHVDNPIRKDGIGGGGVVSDGERSEIVARKPQRLMIWAMGGVDVNEI
jgi:hypothetical protein